MLDVEARAAEFAHPRNHVDDVAESDRPEEISARVHQRNSDNTEGVRKLVRLDPERRLEHLPCAGIEDLEETAVEHDPGRVALAPLDGQLPAIDERRHACLRCAAYKEEEGRRKLHRLPVSSRPHPNRLPVSLPGLTPQSMRLRRNDGRIDLLAASRPGCAGQARARRQRPTLARACTTQ